MSEQKPPSQPETQPTSSTPTPMPRSYTASPQQSVISTQPPTQAQEALTPGQKKMQELLMQLVEKTTGLTVKVAACKCNHKDSCGVYKKAKEIAEIIDKIQELRAEVGT